MKFIMCISRGLLIATLWLPRYSRAQNAGDLQLRVQADVPTGSPTFSLLLVNDTNHDVYIPVPGVNCEDSYSGWVQVHLVFRTPNGRPKPYVGEGCASDRFGALPPILDRLSEKGQEWKILHPGDSLWLMASPFHAVDSVSVSWEILKSGERASRHGLPAFQDDGDPGTYQLWVTYRPPVLAVDDSKTLQERSIDFPRSRLESNRLTFVKKR